jgi:hypothetical protein
MLFGMDNIEVIKTTARDILLAVMCGDNSFSVKDYKALSKLLWGIDMLEVVGCPFIRFGILMDYDRYVEEYVIVYDDDNNFLRFAVDGMERTGMGSDSYERDYLTLDFDDLSKSIAEGKEVELGRLEEWYNDAKSLIEDKEARYTLEYHFLD